MAVDTIYVNDGKSATAYRTISETAEILDLPAHVLRFWETKFPNIKPMTRAGGRRFYRPEDIAALRAIQIYLHEDGLSIQETKAALKELGHRNLVERGFTFIQFEHADTVAQTPATTRADSDKARQSARAAELTNALQNAQGTAPKSNETAHDINSLFSDGFVSGANGSDSKTQSAPETTQAASALAAALSTRKTDTETASPSASATSTDASQHAEPVAKNRDIFTGTTRLRLLAIDAELERMQNRVSHWLEDSAKFS